MGKKLIFLALCSHSWYKVLYIFIVVFGGNDHYSDSLGIFGKFENTVRIKCR